MRFDNKANAILILASAGMLLAGVCSAQAPPPTRSTVAAPHLDSASGETTWQPGGFGKTSDWGAGKGSFGLKPQTGGVWRAGQVQDVAPVSGNRSVPAMIPPGSSSRPAMSASTTRTALHRGLASSTASSSTSPPARASGIRASSPSLNYFGPSQEKSGRTGLKPGVGAKRTRPSTSLEPKTQAPRRGILDTGSSIHSSEAPPE